MMGGIAIRCWLGLSRWVWVVVRRESCEGGWWRYQRDNNMGSCLAEKLREVFWGNGGANVAFELQEEGAPRKYLGAR